MGNEHQKEVIHRDQMSGEEKLASELFKQLVDFSEAKGIVKGVDLGEDAYEKRQVGIWLGNPVFVDIGDIPHSQIQNIDTVTSIETIVEPMKSAEMAARTAWDLEQLRKKRQALTEAMPEQSNGMRECLAEELKDVNKQIEKLQLPYALHKKRAALTAAMPLQSRGMAECLGWELAKIEAQIEKL